MKTNNTKAKKELSKDELEQMKIELLNKEKDYDLHIKGLKESINIENRSKAALEKEIFDLESQIKDKHNENTMIENEGEYSVMKVNTDYDYENDSTNKIGNLYLAKCQEEKMKQEMLQAKIKEIDNEIEKYVYMIQQLQSTQNLEAKEIQKVNDDMQEFLSKI